VTVFLDAGENTVKVEALLGALGYKVVRRFVRQCRSIDAQIERLAEPLSGGERETLLAMLVTDDAPSHGRLVGVDEARAHRRETDVLAKLGARGRLELLQRIVGLKQRRGHG
jgi:hypothetical protein